jgi:hypothetical protein
MLFNIVRSKPRILLIYQYDWVTLELEANLLSAAECEAKFNELINIKLDTEYELEQDESVKLQLKKYREVDFNPRFIDFDLTTEAEKRYLQYWIELNGHDSDHVTFAMRTSGFYEFNPSFKFPKSFNSNAYEPK